MLYKTPDGTIFKKIDKICKNCKYYEYFYEPKEYSQKLECKRKDKKITVESIRTMVDKDSLTGYSYGCNKFKLK